MNTLSDSTKSLWAKKSYTGGLMRWLPLFIHSEDSVAVAEYLWNHWVSKGVQRKIIHGVGDESIAERLFIFLAAVHDLGKATPVFQAKTARPLCRELDERIEERLRMNGLSLPPHHEFRHSSKSPHALATQLLLEQAGCNRNVSVVLGAHHGKPPSTGSLTNSSIAAYGFNYYVDQKSKPAWTSVQLELIEWALRIAGFSSIEDLPHPTMESQVLLSGLLVMTDWIASNETFFPYLPVEETNIGTNDRQRIQYAMNGLALPPPWEAENTWMNSDLCKERFGFSPNPLQEAIAKIAGQVEKPGILVMEAPMGVGKTEAALVCAEIFAYKTGREGVFFALPTQATSDGIFTRLKQWVKQLDFEQHTINLAHGKAQFNEEFQALKSFEGSTNIGMDEESGPIAHEWFQGQKKSILSDFVVGTIDQLLLSALRQKHLMLRHLGLAGKVVIIDECHAYDAYMSQYLNRALNWLGSYDVPVIVLSATLPAEKRQSVVDAYLGRDYLPKKQSDPLAGTPENVEETPSWVLSRDYPLITYTNGAEVKQSNVPGNEREKSISINHVSEEHLITLLREQLVDGGCAGVLVNTVKRSQEISRMLREAFGEDVVELLHSRFLATDRAEKERKLLDELGKPSLSSGRPNLRIIVGTQVLEQSLDIDFDVMITDLCPMDLLLQRIGRLHRHDRVRPAKLSEARCFILEDATNEFSPASEVIYGAYLLMRTKAYLPEKLTLPKDIPSLVQGVYNDEEELCIEQESYMKHRIRWKHLLADKAKRANDFRIGPVWKDGRQTMTGWIDTDVSEHRSEATVRDTDESIEVLLVQQKKNHSVHFLPWVEEGREIILHEPLDPLTAKILARQRIRLPNILCAYGRIDQTIRELEEKNQLYLTQWQQSSWLKGELALVLDESLTAKLGDYRLCYHHQDGLDYEKEGDANV